VARRRRVERDDRPHDVFVVMKDLAGPLLRRGRPHHSPNFESADWSDCSNPAVVKLAPETPWILRSGAQGLLFELGIDCWSMYSERGLPPSLIDAIETFVIVLPETVTLTASIP